MSPVQYKACRCGAKISRSLKRCPDCEKAVQKDYDDNRRDRSKEAFYKSKEWRALRQVALSQNPFCVMCGRPAQIVDHIIEISDGGAALSLENVQCLCSGCHNRKTSVEYHKRKNEGIADDQ